MTDKQSSSLSSLFKSGMDRLDKLGIPAVTQLQSTMCGITGALASRHR